MQHLGREGVFFGVVYFQNLALFCTLSNSQILPTAASSLAYSHILGPTLLLASFSEPLSPPLNFVLWETHIYASVHADRTEVKIFI